MSIYHMIHSQEQISEKKLDLKYLLRKWDNKLCSLKQLLLIILVSQH